jgi:hypothetical protein
VLRFRITTRSQVRFAVGAKSLVKIFLMGSRMATCHGVQKDGMVLILSLEMLLS